MRYLLCFLILLTAALAGAEVFRLNPAATLTVTCAVGGGAAVAVAHGYYEIHVSGETSHVCYANSCGAGGMERVRGNHGVSQLVEGQVSCRSGGSGVVQLVPAVFVR